MTEGARTGKTGYVFCGGTISEKLLPWIRKELSGRGETGREDGAAAEGRGKEIAESAGSPYVIAADRGLVFLKSHGIVPDLVVGDFDSSPAGFIDQYRSEHPGVEIRTYNPEKDYTDSEIGARAAVSAGCRRVVIIGGTGTRLDHVLGNIQVLAYLLSAGAEGEMVDPCNRITLHVGPFSIRRVAQWGKYVSLFAYGGDVTGLTLTGFHYDVKEFLLTPVGSRAVSNEIDGEEGSISFSSGRLLVIESRDSV